jgi:hypothetical protein
MEIQEAKKDLARVLFSPHEDSQAGDFGRLEVCLTLVHCESSPRKLLELADETIVALQFALTDELSPAASWCRFERRRDYFRLANAANIFSGSCGNTALAVY